MKTNDLRSLQTLRQLREQRASTELAAQQQRCRDTHHVLDDAKDKLRLHRESIARKAEAIYGLFSEGLSVSAWQAAQEHLEELADSQRTLEESVQQYALILGVQEKAREAFHLQHRLRQRKAEACDLLLEARLKGERQPDDTDDMPVSAPRNMA